MTPDELVTKQDLLRLKQELIKEFEAIVVNHIKQEKEYLRTKDLMERLSIRPTAVRSFIERGILKPRKVGGVNYFLWADVKKLFV